MKISVVNRDGGREVIDCRLWTVYPHAADGQTPELVIWFDGAEAARYIPLTAIWFVCSVPEGA